MRKEWFYEDFTRKVREILEGEGVKFEYGKVKKLNDTNMTAISIRNFGENMIEMSPRIYLEPLYQKFLAQKDAPYLAVEEIKKMYNESVSVGSQFTLKNFLKPENIRMIVINKLFNKELLQNLPHIEKEDLAIIYMYSMDGEFTAKITYELMRKNNLSPNKLFEIAYENMKKDNYKVKNLKDIYIADKICFLTPEQVEEINNLPDMYVVTNENEFYGAPAIMNKELLQKFGKEKGYEKFYILPSSIHEIIIIPLENEINNPEELHEMVSIINNSNVMSNEKVLSYSVYLYTVAEGDFCIAYPK